MHMVGCIKIFHSDFHLPIDWQVAKCKNVILFQKISVFIFFFFFYIKFSITYKLISSHEGIWCVIGNYEQTTIFGECIIKCKTLASL